MHHSALRVCRNVSLRSLIILWLIILKCVQMCRSQSALFSLHSHFDRGINEWLCKWVPQKDQSVLLKSFKFRGSDTALLSTDMCTTTWVENMTMWWRSWWLRCAPSASPSCGWDPVRWCCSGLSLTVSASTLSCGPPSSSPWSLLRLSRSVLGGCLLHFSFHKALFVYS